MNFAIRQRPVADCKIQAKLATPSPGKTYQDWLRVFESLRADGFIRIEDGRLERGSLRDNLPLETKLLSGDSDSWALLEILDSKNRFIRKFDAKHLVELGKKGEDAVLSELFASLPKHLHTRIRHTSLTDDSAGYDILGLSLADPNRQVFLEVKASCRGGQTFSFYLSRNEATVGKRNPNWSIILVKIIDNVSEILGRVKFDVIEQLLPIDTSPNARWESAHISLDPRMIIPGLP